MNGDIPIQNIFCRGFSLYFTVFSYNGGCTFFSFTKCLFLKHPYIHTLKYYSILLKGPPVLYHIELGCCVLTVGPFNLEVPDIFQLSGTLMGQYCKT